MVVPSKQNLAAHSPPAQGWTTASLEAISQPEALDTTPGLITVFSRLHAQLPAVLVLQRETTRIGREADNEVPIVEPAVSRYHARLERRSDGVWLIDNASTNGTLVNGVRITERRLEPHDVVRIGDSVFRFTASNAQEYGPYRLEGVIEAHRTLRPKVRSDLIGGYQIDLILSALEKVARAGLACVVTGESGTGKELVARTIHEASERRGPYLAVNCAALPANLLESELFGFRRGAFTGATQDKTGLVRAANGGTLFLDEIGDMPLEAQAKLLRVVQEREVLPLGATQPERVDVRIVCATHRDLDHEVATGRFRGDLFARLREFMLRVPPLRERKEDLYPLTQRFLARAGKPDARVSLPFMLALAHYPWPYNVRELESAIRLSVALADGAELAVQHLPEGIRQGVRDHGRVESPSSHVSERLPERSPGERTLERTPTEEEMRDLCARHRGNVTTMGRELGKERMQVHRWLKRYNIDVDAYRA
jgi:DNA-binding NtrC family response regulator